LDSSGVKEERRRREGARDREGEGRGEKRGYPSSRERRRGRLAAGVDEVRSKEGKEEEMRGEKDTSVLLIL